jgi:hypothetical protein
MSSLSSDGQVYRIAKDISKSDTVNFPDGPCNAIYVGGAGIVVAIMADGNNAVSFTCVAGQILPIRAKRVNSTTTTATLMVALY